MVNITYALIIKLPIWWPDDALYSTRAYIQSIYSLWWILNSPILGIPSPSPTQYEFSDFFFPPYIFHCLEWAVQLRHSPMGRSTHIMLLPLVDSIRPSTVLISIVFPCHILYNVVYLPSIATLHPVHHSAFQMLCILTEFQMPFSCFFFNWIC